jgi:hypothetical protein
MKSSATSSTIVTATKIKADNNLTTQKSTSLTSSEPTTELWRHPRDRVSPSGPISSPGNVKDLDTNDDIQSISSALELTQSNIEIKDQNLLDLQLNAARKLRQVCYHFKLSF